MNEEISRILKLLEDGKISANEAERLLRLVMQGPGSGTSSAKRWECCTGEPGAVWRGIRRALRSMARAQRRSAWWQYFWTVRQAAEGRRKRAAEMTIAERVQHIFVACGLADKENLSSEATLEGDLGFSAITRQLLRFALEDEFGIAVTDDDVARFVTLADVVAFVERHTVTPPAAEPPAAEAAQESPAPAQG